MFVCERGLDFVHQRMAEAGFAEFGQVVEDGLAPGFAVGLRNEFVTMGEIERARLVGTVEEHQGVGVVGVSPK